MFKMAQEIVVGARNGWPPLDGYVHMWRTRYGGRCQAGRPVPGWSHVEPGPQEVMRTAWTFHRSNQWRLSLPSDTHLLGPNRRATGGGAGGWRHIERPDKHAACIRLSRRGLDVRMRGRRWQVRRRSCSTPSFAAMGFLSDGRAQRSTPAHPSDGIRAVMEIEPYTQKVRCCA